MIPGLGRIPVQCSTFLSPPCAPSEKECPSPTARAANSGISAIIDAYGRVRARLDLGLRGIVDSDLPVALAPTPFARYGNFILLTLIIVCSGAVLWPPKVRQT